MKNLMLVTACALWSLTACALAADATLGAEKAQPCQACHGAGGNGSNPQWPKLAAQHADYTYKQLINFKSGERQNEVMAAQVANLSDEDMQDLAVYFAGTQAMPASADADLELIEQGEALYRGGNPESGVPACSGCHSPTGSGNPAAKFPLIYGQYAQYIEAQLRAFRAGERNNDPNAMMRGVAERMTDREMQAVAAYLQGLRPATKP